MSRYVTVRDTQVVLLISISNFMYIILSRNLIGMLVKAIFLTLKAFDSWLLECIQKCTLAVLLMIILLIIMILKFLRTQFN
jgi:hypothetical protein